MNDRNHTNRAGYESQTPDNNDAQVYNSGALWNSHLGRRAFLKKTGAATVATAVALHGFRVQVLANTTGGTWTNKTKEEIYTWSITCYTDDGLEPHAEDYALWLELTPMPAAAKEFVVGTRKLIKAKGALESSDWSRLEYFVELIDGGAVITIVAKVTYTYSSETGAPFDDPSDELDEPELPEEPGGPDPDLFPPPN